MAEYVLRVVAGNGGGPDPAGLYVVDCDVDAHFGMGEAVLTAERDKARRFSDVAAALEFWRRRSTERPTRFDGKPNRPLTAYSIETEQISPP